MAPVKTVLKEQGSDLACGLELTNVWPKPISKIGVTTECYNKYS